MSEHRLTPEQYLKHVRADAAVVRAAAQLAPDSVVPDLDGWTALTVLEHLGDVYMHKVEVLRLGHPPDPWPPPGPDPEPFAWFDSALAQLLDELGSRSPGDPAWTFASFDQSVGFWHRRMAHESAVHRQDSEGAVGARTPIEDALAVDGVDEILGLFAAVPTVDTDVTPLTGTIEVRAGGASWTLDMGPRRLTVTTGPAGRADVTLAGSPDAVLWWLWRGIDLGLEITGDAGLLTGVRAHIAAVSG
ncbi:MAG TPA: maleylpyruvate isomerase N-terminal domain-containing protein [Actinopolymorphaceae bacterium]|jgi:uncharacterized protein (TIGR03083 family)